MSKSKPPKKLRIGFIHPDLGIAFRRLMNDAGGAERLVVDAAVSLQNRGHDVTIFTSRHDPSRCFEETRDGTLKVHVLGSSLPMRLHPKLPMIIVFSILRSVLLTILLSISLFLPGPPSFFNPLSPLEPFDIFVVDQQSVCVPLLRFITGTRVVFYCHFPDKLLSQGWEIKGDRAVRTSKGSLLRTLYRFPVDKLEELTTGQSDIILANSKFTSRIYASAFPTLAKRPPRVVYPCIDLDQYNQRSKLESKGKGKAQDVKLLASDLRSIVSLNRFEAKKNVELALRAFAKLRSEALLPKSDFEGLRLVIGGGYDTAVADNVDTLTRLRKLCDDLSLSHDTIDAQITTIPPPSQVLFVLNFTSDQRTFLLTDSKTVCLVYTPTNEHFGIVPIEAGACGLPVLAVNSGGPTETVIDGETGLLRPAEVDQWSSALAELVEMGESERKKMSKAARERVKRLFSLDTLGENLDQAIKEALVMGDLHSQIGDRLIWGGVGLMAIAGGGFALTLLLSR